MLGTAPSSVMAPRSSRDVVTENHLADSNEHASKHMTTISTTSIVSRSALGMASVYNRLPPEIVSAKTGEICQCKLQAFSKECAHRGVNQWQDLYSTRMGAHEHPLIQMRLQMS